MIIPACCGVRRKHQLSLAFNQLRTSLGSKHEHGLRQCAAVLLSASAPRIA